MENSEHRHSERGDCVGCYVLMSVSIQCCRSRCMYEVVSQFLKAVPLHAVLAEF